MHAFQQGQQGYTHISVMNQSAGLMAALTPVAAARAEDYRWGGNIPAHQRDDKQPKQHIFKIYISNEIFI